MVSSRVSDCAWHVSALPDLRLWASLCGPYAGQKQTSLGPGNSGGRAPCHSSSTIYPPS